MPDHQQAPDSPIRGFLLVTAVAGTLVLLLGVGAVTILKGTPQTTRLSLEEGFAHPPMTARPATYYLLLNGYVNRDHVDRELEEFHRAGIGGLCIFDMGARGAPETLPPPGPTFLGPESTAILAHIIRKAGSLGMEADLSVSSSWDMGGRWVEPRDASMGLFSSHLTVEGPRRLDMVLPLPPLPEATPRREDGLPRIAHEVAVLGIPQPKRMPGHEFVFRVGGDHDRIATIDRVVFHGVPVGAGEPTPAKDFVVAASNAPEGEDTFRDLVQGSLEARAGPQVFKTESTPVRRVRLRILSGHDPKSERVQLAEFEAYTPAGENVLLGYRSGGDRLGSRLERATTPTSRRGDWAPGNIHDGRVGDARRRWASSGPPPLVIDNVGSIVNLTDRLGPDGRLSWDVPAGKWVIQRYLCTNTGERLKVPSPESDGLATDHLNAGATRRYMQSVIDRLKPAIGDFRSSALRELYLASYEVVGQIWTPDLLEQFRRRRGYDLAPYLPVLDGGLVNDRETTGRVTYDFRKTLGEVLVDAYYRAAANTAHAAGLNIESEAGGPGPPVHEVPVDALAALGTMDAVRGEFWPFRPDAHALWVIKETASAAHIYGKRRVHMEAFTSVDHWMEAPGSLKSSADRAFCEGMNHVVWHTASHHPPEAGKPGWVYGAGTHLGPNRIWWPMARPFLDYLARASFMLQQGSFVADVLYYYGDHGYNFVLPPGHDPRIDDASRGSGYDYDVTNADVILNRLSARDGKLVLPDGMSYEVLVLPDRIDIDLEVLRKIETLVTAGATVIGRRPTRSTGFSGFPERDRQVEALGRSMWGDCDGSSVKARSIGRGRIVCGGTVRDALAERGIAPDFTWESAAAGAEVDYVHRRTAEADVYFIRNKQDRFEEIVATFRVAGRRAEIWRPDTGEMFVHAVQAEVNGRMRLPLRLAPGEAFFVVFRSHGREAPTFTSVEDVGISDAGIDYLNHGGTPVAFAAGRYTFRKADGSSKQIEIARLPEPVTLDGPWRVSFPDGWGAPRAIRLDRLTSWTEREDPGVRYFSGIGEYFSDFQLPESWLASGRRVILDLGRLWAVAEVEVNGKKAGVLWKEPYRVDVTAAARPGRNELRVRVANTWANRLIGDARHPEKKPFTRTNITRTGNDGRPWAEVDPIPSGLFGPVRLVPGQVVDGLAP